MTNQRIVAAAALATATLLSAGPSARAADPAPVQITIGYQPYFTSAWGALVVKERELWKKYLPPGSTVDWEVGLQGSVITNNMLAGKYQFGYVGDMPGVVATTKRSQGDVRILMMTAYTQTQCNNVLVRPDAPKFANPHDAVKWLGGKTVAIPRGTCSDRFAREIFKREGVTPGTVLNEGIEATLANIRAGKVDGAIIWEPNVAHVGDLIGNKSARLVATGAAWGLYDGAELVGSKDFMDQHPGVAAGLIKAELEAEQFIASDYPKNACALVDYAQKNTTGFERKELWFSLYGDDRFPGGPASSVRFASHPAFDGTARGFLNDASQFLLDAKVIAQPMPADAIFDGPLQQALRETHASTQPSIVQPKPAASYPCN